LKLHRLHANFGRAISLRVIAAIVAINLSASFLAGCGSGGERMLSVYLASNREELSVPNSVDDTPVRFVVEPGTPARQIGRNLQSAGLIADDLLFEAYVRVNGLDDRLEAGTFVLNPSMSLQEIVSALQDARASSVIVTIPEGWRREQVVELLVEQNLFDDGEDSNQAKRYADKTATGDLSGLDPSRYSFLQERPAGVGLEGYLFPDTYEIAAADATAEDLLARQLDTFVDRVLPRYEDAIAQGTTTMDLYAVLTMASIVEREAVIAEERPAIAAVYLNRLANGMKLDADPTVQYAMGYQPESGQWWKTPVFLEEYAGVDSPYNTYLYAGLPPGPIASPGLASIEAVLFPDDHDYLYFVALPDGSGGHVFANTFEEHQENVRRYLGGQ
jgi:UPF0755 protein